MKKFMQQDLPISSQIIAEWCDIEKSQRLSDLTKNLSQQDSAFLEATQEMDKIRDFVRTPEHILGSDATKHGEVAEHVHVGVHRARDILDGQTPSASFENVDRFAPEDYLVGDVHIQSKFSNNVRDSLDGVLKHSDKYPDFMSNNKYHIPKDQYEQIRQFRQQGSVEGLSTGQIKSLERRITEIESRSGRSFEDIVQGSEVTYEEAQLQNVENTLNNRQEDLHAKNEDMKQTIRDQAGPNFSGAMNAMAMGAAAGGGVRLASSFYVKYKEGKNPFKGDFSKQDWRDVGIDALKGAGTGAISAGGLYYLTNATDLAAPFAGAVVSSIMGIGNLLSQYQKGNLTSEEFFDMSMIVATDSAIVGLGTFAGQTLIPIPIVGGLIGSIAGKIVSSILQDKIFGYDKKLIAELDVYLHRFLKKLDAQYEHIVREIKHYFRNLDSLLEQAFDITKNTTIRMNNSIRVARFLDVDDEDIIHSIDELDAFMME